MYYPLGFYVGPDRPLCRVCADIEARREHWNLDDAIAIFPDTESDTPTHCENCEALIEHALTSDGYEYVGEALVRAARGDGRRCIVGAWFEQYGDDIDEEYLRDFAAEVIRFWPTSDAYSPKDES